MGLDMYLHKKVGGKVYDFSKQYPNNRANKVVIKTITTFGDGEIKEAEHSIVNPEFDIEILLPFAYWRKANAIHKWILDYTEEDDNCQQIWLNGKALLKLVELCKQVLADHSKAPDLLPTCSGFFFGSTEYDEWYFDYLQRTCDMLQDVKPDEDFIYQASW
jgi:hypothetical protein